jgi:hypothetical protein
MPPLFFELGEAAAQRADVHVQRIVGHLAVRPPYRADQVVAEDDRAACLGETLEHAEAAPVERHRHPVPVRLAPHRIHRQPAEADRLRRAQRLAPLQHGETGEQFLEGEGLGEIIVRPRHEAVQLVAQAAARGEHHHGQARRMAAQRAAQIEPVHVGQAEIEQHHAERLGVDAGEHLRALAMPGDAVAPRGQPARHEASDADIVLDQQDVHAALSTGSVIAIVQPPPGSLAAAIVPPCCSTTQRASARPSPVPPRSRPASAW